MWQRLATKMISTGIYDMQQVGWLDFNGSKIYMVNREGHEVW